MNLVYVLLLILSMLFNLVLLLRLNKKNGGVSIASGVIFSLIFYFHLIPILIYAGIASDDSDVFIRTAISAEPFQVVRAIALIAVFSICVYIFGTNNLSIKKEVGDHTLHARKNNSVLKFLALFSLVVGGVSFLFYMMSFGGFQQMLQNSAYIRSFSIDSSKYIDGLSALLIVPTRLILAAPILLFAICREEKKKMFKVAFVVSVVLSVMFLLFNSGKTQIVQFIVPFIVVFLSKRVKHPWVCVIIIGLLSIPLLGVLDSIFYYYGYGEWKVQESGFSSYVASFTYPFTNLLNIGSLIDASGFQLFSIVPMSIIGIVPGVEYIPSYTYTSMLYNGENWQRKFGVPADVLSVSYMQCNFVGVMIVGSLIGILSLAVNRRIAALNEKRNVYEPILFAVISLAFTFVVDADLGAMIKGTYLLYFGCICLMMSCTKKSSYVCCTTNNVLAEEGEK